MLARRVSSSRTSARAAATCVRAARRAARPVRGSGPRSPDVDARCSSARCSGSCGSDALSPHRPGSGTRRSCSRRADLRAGAADRGPRCDGSTMSLRCDPGRNCMQPLSTVTSSSGVHTDRLCAVTFGCSQYASSWCHGVSRPAVAGLKIMWVPLPGEDLGVIDLEQAHTRSAWRSRTTSCRGSRAQ